MNGHSSDICGIVAKPILVNYLCDAFSASILMPTWFKCLESITHTVTPCHSCSLYCTNENEIRSRCHYFLKLPQCHLLIKQKSIPKWNQFILSILIQWLKLHVHVYVHVNVWHSIWMAHVDRPPGLVPLSVHYSRAHESPYNFFLPLPFRLVLVFLFN